MSKPEAIAKRAASAAGWLVCSPWGWVVCGTALIALWAVAHALGWRAYTGVFSGTPPTEGAPGDGLMLLGLLYAGLYFTAVLVAPVLILAGLLRWTVLGVMSRVVIPKMGQAGRP